MQTITVAFVNPVGPKAKVANIKGTDGVYYSVEEGDLYQYQKGMTFSVEPVRKGQYFWMPKGFDPAGGASQAAKQPAQTGPAYGNSGVAHTHTAPAPPRPAGNGHTDKTPMQIFVTGIVGRAMGSGKFGIDDIPELTRKAREAWDLHG